MSRGFSGSRYSSGNGKLSEAAKLKRMEIMRGGKLPMTSADRYKRIMKKKMEEHQQQVSLRSSRVMSKKAQEALKQMAMKKAAKEEKELRQMVIIKPRMLGDAGRIDEKGRVYDVANNLVLKVDGKKKGAIRTMGGMTLGRYKPKSGLSNMLLGDNIKKYSPYFIKLKQMQMQQQMLEQQALDAAIAQGGVYSTGGDLTAVSLHGGNLYQQGGVYGPASQYEADVYGNRTNQFGQQEEQHRGGGATVNAWGVASGNIHGTFAENVWGGMADNVWGGSSSNVWGGIGGNSWGSSRGYKIWGSGTPGQKNYLRPLWVFFTTMLGFKGGKHRHGKHAAGRHAAGRHGGRHGGAPRTAGRTGGR